MFSVICKKSKKKKHQNDTIYNFIVYYCGLLNKSSMLKRVVLLIIVSVSLGCSNNLFAQDPEFTQFYANPLYLNPAMAGTANCPRFCLNYRNQWPAISGTYVTYSASYDQHFDALKGGLGLLVYDDRAGQGTLTTFNASGMYSYLLNVNRKFSLRFGLEASYFEKSIDWSKLTFGDMIDERMGFVYNTREIPGKSKVSYADFSAGVFGYTKRFYFGFAANHLTQPNEGFIGTSQLPMKLTGPVGALFQIGDKRNEVTVSPNVLYQQQGTFQQLNLGLYATKGSIVGGLWYRNQDAFIALIGFQQPHFKVGYSYDITVSKLTNATAGSHEISCSLILHCKPKKKHVRTVNCPSF